jgi:hypothetical protein
MITVAQLIAHLQTLPQDMQVIYTCCSDYSALEIEDISIVKAVDKDFYVMRPHRTMSKENVSKLDQYVLFPGN